jgi:hypothetical protein
MNVHKLAEATSVLKFYGSGNLGKKRVILAYTDIKARLELGATLPHDDGPAIHQFSGKALDSKSLRLAVSSVSGAPDSFFVCHTDLLACYINFFDADFRMPLTMPACAAILLLCLVFKDKNCIVFILRFQLAQYRGAFHQWLADVRFRIGFYKKHLFKLDRGSRINREFLHADEVSFGDTVLFSAAHNHCIHGLTSLGRNRRFNQEAAEKATIKISISAGRQFSRSQFADSGENRGLRGILNLLGGGVSAGKAGI